MKQHNDLCQLLPWYVNGTLDTESMEQMNEHLDSCERCAADFEISMKFSRSLQQPPEGVDALLDQQSLGFNQLKQRIDQATATKQSIAQSTAKSNNSFWLFLQRLWENYQWIFSMSGGAAIAMVLVLLGPNLIDQNVPVNNEEFALLSSEKNLEHPVVQIIFEPNTTEQQMRELMLAQQVQLIDGPTRTGVYRLKISGVQDASYYAEKLSSLSYVRWAASE